MKAVILCGGQGTRLREETEFRPKPMVEVGGRPILWHIMKTYASHGITDFVLCVGYKGDMIKEYFLNYEALNNDFTITLGETNSIQIEGTHDEANWTVTVADTGPLTQTAGRLAQIQKYVKDDEMFCVTYGDGVADVDITAELAFHKEHGKMATVTTVQIPSRFGVLNIADHGGINDFAEKATTDGWVNGGYFIFNSDVFNYFTENEPLEHGPLVNLTKDGQLMAWQHGGFWQPMDTFRESSMLNEMWDNGEAPWKVWA